MHENRPLNAAVLTGGLARVVVRVPDQMHRDARLAEMLDALDLLKRGDSGHEDGGPDAQRGAGEGHALGMIAGAGADHAARRLLRRQPRDLVVGPADLEGAHFLEVFALQQDPSAIEVREPLAGLQRRARQHRSQALGGVVDGAPPIERAGLQVDSRSSRKRSSA